MMSEWDVVNSTEVGPNGCDDDEHGSFVNVWAGLEVPDH